MRADRHYRCDAVGKLDAGIRERNQHQVSCNVTRRMPQVLILGRNSTIRCVVECSKMSTATAAFCRRDNLRQSDTSIGSNTTPSAPMPGGRRDRTAVLLLPTALFMVIGNLIRIRAVTMGHARPAISRAKHARHHACVLRHSAGERNCCTAANPCAYSGLTRPGSRSWKASPRSTSRPTATASAT